MRRPRTTCAVGAHSVLPRALLLALALLAAPACAPRFTTTTVPAGRMGEARLYLPREPAGSLVLLFSDAAGWNDALGGVAAKLASAGTIVVGVDLPTYQKGLAASDDGCHYLLSEIEELSHRIERERGFARYRSPVLAGIGAGGALAYAALAQAPAATVAGAVSVDPSAVLATRVPLCPGAVATSAAAGGFSYAARDQLPGWWHVSVPADAHGVDAAALTAPAVVETAAPGASAADRLVALVAAALGSDDGSAAAPGGLSVVPYRSESGSDTLAIIYSGDGGWRDLDKQIGEALAARGLPVVGVDSLRSFWTARTPAEMAEGLGALIRTYEQRWGTKRVALIGYSFGADVLPFAINLLPPELRAQIVLVALLGVEPRADFEVHVTGWLGQQPDEQAPQVLPQLLALDLSRVQCFYGEEEEDTLCRAPELAAKAEIIRTSGGHHFDGDYAALARRILEGIARRAPGALPAEPEPAPSP